jgi:hypothetical protein
MSAHTPGPWEIMVPENRRGQSLPPKVVKNGSPIATLNITGTGDREANARLIAAAPEMLTALQAVVEDWQIASETWEDDRDLGPASKSGEPRELQEVAPETIAAVRAVIAKAEGRAV